MVPPAVAAATAVAPVTCCWACEGCCMLRTLMGWGLLPPPGDAAVAAEEAAAAAWMLMYLVAVDEAAVFGTTNAALAGVEVVNCNKLQHAYLL